MCGCLIMSMLTSPRLSTKEFLCEGKHKITEDFDYNQFCFVVFANTIPKHKILSQLSIMGIHSKNVCVYFARHGRNTRQTLKIGKPRFLLFRIQSFWEHTYLFILISYLAPKQCELPLFDTLLDVTFCFIF